jgi:coenzyme Q-binding protein COQ10
MRPLAGGFAVDFPDLDAVRLFRLAVDVEDYPHFIPWCLAARVRRRDGNRLDVENHFGAGPVDIRFRSRAEAHEPDLLVITSTDGPFRHFRLEWRFEPMPAGGCRVIAAYHMDLRSPLLHGLARVAMPEMERRVASRFRQRALQVYGGG